MIAADGLAVICTKVEAQKRAGEAGWLHWLNGAERPAVRPATVRARTPRLSHKAWELMAKRFSQCLEPARLDALASSLRLPRDSLTALGVGYSHDDGAFTFPMSNGARRFVGIQLRQEGTGRKWAIHGSNNGLFIPFGRVWRKLFITEGPSDTAAVVSLGLYAIGRPGCEGGRDLIREFVRRHRITRLILLPDTDEPGMNGARRLVQEFPGMARIVKLGGHKDVRAWVTAGGTRDDLISLAIQANAWQNVTERRSSCGH